MEKGILWSNESSKAKQELYIAMPVGIVPVGIVLVGIVPVLSPLGTFSTPIQPMIIDVWIVWIRPGGDRTYRGLGMSRFTALLDRVSRYKSADEVGGGCLINVIDSVGKVD